MEPRAGDQSRRAGNLTTGPVAWALSSMTASTPSDYSWISGSGTWTIDPANTLRVAAGGSVSTSQYNTVASPYQLQNSDIVNVIYTYNAAPWTISPYFQYTNNKHSAIYNPAPPRTRRAGVARCSPTTYQ